MADLRITRLTNEDAKFYATLGPFLAKREVHKVISAPPWDDAGKTWFVCWRNGKVAGFAGVVIDGEKASFCSDYTPEVVVRELLIRERSKWAKAQGAHQVSAVVGTADEETYVRHGFEVARKLKNFTVMRKELKWASV